jgi:uncharacterized cupin superfamily protein
MAKTLVDVVNFATSNAQTEHYPTPPERRIKGAPEQTATTHFSDGKHFYAGEWSADVGSWKVSYTEYEYFRLLEGRSILRDASGAELLLEPGDEICVPAGFEGEWEVLEPTRKVFVIYEP